MTGLAVLRMVGSLALVLGLLVLGVWLARQRGLRPLAGRRLGVVERLPVDTRRSLLLVRWDAEEHLLLLAPEGQTLVASRRGEPRGSAAASAADFAAALEKVAGPPLPATSDLAAGPAVAAVTAQTAAVGAAATAARRPRTRERRKAGIA